jgi:hypothetical protein
MFDLDLVTAILIAIIILLLSGCTPAQSYQFGQFGQGLNQGFTSTIQDSTNCVTTFHRNIMGAPWANTNCW